MMTTCPKFKTDTTTYRPAAYRALPVTPSDTALLPRGALGLSVTGAGNVAVELADGGTAVLSALAARQVVDLAVSKILATGTTASGVCALY